MKTRAVLLGLSMTALSVAGLSAMTESAARADDVDRPEPTYDHHPRGVHPGLQIGARVGFGAGTGSVYDGFKVSEGSNGFVPFTADIGARILRELYVGAYGSYAYVIPKTNATSCPDTFDCSVKDWRVGAEADWHFLPSHSLDPYVGVFGGYELLQNRVTGSTQVPIPGVGPAPGAVDARVNDKGWEIGLAAGADIRLARVLALGPYLSASLGRYIARTGSTDVRVNGNTVSSTSAPEVDHAYHELFMLGVRGTLNTL